MCGCQDAIQRPFEARDPVARARLIALLKRLAIRASKDDLITLVKCHRKASQSHPFPCDAVSQAPHTLLEKQGSGVSGLQDKQGACGPHA